MDSGWVDPSRLLAVLKESVRSRILIALVLGLVLFAPEELLDRLMLRTVRDRFGFAAGIGFALATFSVGLSAVGWCYSRAAGWMSRVNRKREILHRLDQLSPEEQAILQFYVHRRTNTQYFDLRDGRIAGLVRDGILFKSAPEGFVYSWAFNIEPWIRQYLDGHRELLGLTADRGRCGESEG
jgi:hypothetical protein